jgi:hypothetical protein
MTIQRTCWWTADKPFIMRYDKKLMSFFNVNISDDLIMAGLMMDVNEKSLREERV